MKLESWLRMEKGIATLFVAALLLLGGCDKPSQYIGKEMPLDNDTYLLTLLEMGMNGWQGVKVTLNTCTSKTFDNKGCMRGASIYQYDALVGSADWWVVEAYGEKQIKLAYFIIHKRGSSSDTYVDKREGVIHLRAANFH